MRSLIASAGERGSEHSSSSPASTSSAISLCRALAVEHRVAEPVRDPEAQLLALAHVVDEHVRQWRVERVRAVHAHEARDRALDRYGRAAADLLGHLTRDPGGRLTAGIDDVRVEFELRAPHASRVPEKRALSNSGKALSRRLHALASLSVCLSPASRASPHPCALVRAAFAEPTPAQAQAWPAIASGEHVLISAPTGSGKTLAAFLWALDRLAAERSGGSGPAPRRRADSTSMPDATRRTRLVYVSPLKALSYDIERNLRAPLRGIGADLRVAIRTGDTPQRERARMLREPPDILITTPESLYLMLTSGAREILRGARVADRRRDPRGRRDQARRPPRADARAPRRARRARRCSAIGLSATQRPLEEVARFLVGPTRTCRIVDAGVRKPLDLKIHVPVESMTEPGARAWSRECRCGWAGHGSAGVDPLEPQPSGRRRRGAARLDLAGDLPRAAAS